MLKPARRLKCAVSGVAVSTPAPSSDIFMPIAIRARCDEPGFSKLCALHTWGAMIKVSSRNKTYTFSSSTGAVGAHRYFFGAGGYDVLPDKRSFNLLSLHRERLDAAWGPLV